MCQCDIRPPTPAAAAAQHYCHKLSALGSNTPPRNRQTTPGTSCSSRGQGAPDSQASRQLRLKLVHTHPHPHPHKNSFARVKMSVHISSPACLSRLQHPMLHLMCPHKHTHTHVLGAPEPSSKYNQPTTPRHTPFEAEPTGTQTLHPQINRCQCGQQVSCQTSNESKQQQTWCACPCRHHSSPTKKAAEAAVVRIFSRHRRTHHTSAGVCRVGTCCCCCSRSSRNLEPCRGTFHRLVILINHTALLCFAHNPPGTDDHQNLKSR